MKEFLSDPEFQQELSQEAEAVREHLRTLRPATAITAGTSFLFAETLNLPVQWVAVLQHKDNSSLWFLVAADDYPLVGSCDIELAEAASLAPLVLRCGVGLWAHAADIEADKYVGSIDPAYVDYARDRLSGMVLGDLPSTEACRIADSDPDYEEWLGELSRAAGQIEARIQSEPVVRGAGAFSTDWSRPFFQVAEEPSDYGALAADSTGQLQPEAPSHGRLLKSSLPGKLVALLADGELDLLYEPSERGESPPGVVVVGHDDDDQGSWKLKPDGRLLWSVPIPLHEGRVTFRLGTESFTVEL